MRIKKALRQTSFVLSIPVFIMSFSLHAAADFISNRIIDDSVFDNVNTMTIDQIDSFLNGFSGSCISTNNGFSAPDPTGYSPSTGYTYGGNSTAGKVIFDAAAAYGLNPRVLLVTLQKEQSLVTGTSGCSTLRYTGATGYGCPDGGTTYNYSGLNLYSINGSVVGSVSGTCVNTAAKAGFSQQLIHSAWLLKFGEQRAEGNIGWNVQRNNYPQNGDHWDNSDDPPSCYPGPMTQGTFKTCPTGSAVYYDGLKTIDGTSVHMDNGATASLYWYTPHFHGNQSFVSIWESWYGVNSMYTPSFAWQSLGVVIQDEGKNSEIPTDNMHSGERLYAQVSAKNTGSVTWTNSGPNPTRLATFDPMNGYTPYCDVTWASLCTRPATLAEATVAPGQVGHFNFYMAVPNVVGSYRTYFAPVAEYQSWMSNNEGFNIYVRNSGHYEWQWLYFDAFTDSTKTTAVDMNHLTRNQKIYIVLHVKNVSATVWTNSGPNPVRLGTASPQDQTTPLYDSSWPAINRPGVLDQTTLNPGQEGTFSFTIKAPSNLGIFRQYLKPVLEYKGWTRDDANHIYLNVTQ